MVYSSVSVRIKVPRTAEHDERSALSVPDDWQGVQSTGEVYPLSPFQNGRKMLEIEGLSKEAVYNLMTELLYSLNYSLFRFEDWLRTRYPEELEGEELHRLYKESGSYEAKRLCKALNTSGGGVDTLIHLLRHSHWAVFENIEARRLTERSFIMRTIECSAQRAAQRWGTEYYDCRLTASLIRAGFFEALNHNVKIQRIFTPPETGPEGTPENVSCEWLISIE